MPRTSARIAGHPPDGNEEIAHDSLKGALPDPPLKHIDYGFSWANMLRFKGITFKSGGTFKLCFCESTLVPVCMSERDFSVEVGKIHVSGVSCLISQPSLRNAACVKQFYGDEPKSLRCYAGEPPSLTP